jgi:hypothetical protein
LSKGDHFRKFGTGSKERISGSIPLQIGPVETGTIYLQKCQELSFVNLGFLEREPGKKLEMVWNERNRSGPKSS